MEPQERVADLLYDGETVVEPVEIEGNAVVVTSHRVLVLTPDGDGANYRHADRPNVSGVGVDTVGASRWVKRTFSPFLLAVVLLAGGWVVDLDGITSALGTEEADAASRTGVGGIVSMAKGLGRALALLDEALLVGGAFCLLLVAVFLGLYVQSRTRQLTLVVSGDDDLTVPIESDHPEAVGALRELLGSSE